MEDSDVIDLDSDRRQSPYSDRARRSSRQPHERAPGTLWAPSSSEHYETNADIPWRSRYLPYWHHSAKGSDSIHATSAGQDYTGACETVCGTVSEAILAAHAAW